MLRLISGTDKKQLNKTKIVVNNVYNWPEAFLDSSSARIERHNLFHSPVIFPSALLSAFFIGYCLVSNLVKSMSVIAIKFSVWGASIIKRGLIFDDSTYI